jgi:hypothetical protein
MIAINISQRQKSMVTPIQASVTQAVIHNGDEVGLDWHRGGDDSSRRWHADPMLAA